MRELRDDKGKFVAGHKKVGGMPKGGHQTEEAKNRISASLVGRTAEQARRWKGEKASYQAKHMWARKHYGRPNRCEQKGCSYPKAVNAGRTVKYGVERKGFVVSFTTDDYDFLLTDKTRCVVIGNIHEEVKNENTR